MPDTTPRRRLGDTDSSLGERIARLEATVEAMSERHLAFGLMLGKFEERLASVEKTLWKGVGALSVLIVLIDLLAPFIQNALGLPR